MDRALYAVLIFILMFPFISVAMEYSWVKPDGFKGLMQHYKIKRQLRRIFLLNGREEVKVKWYGELIIIGEWIYAYDQSVILFSRATGMPRGSNLEDGKKLLELLDSVEKSSTTNKKISDLSKFRSIFKD